MAQEDDISSWARHICRVGQEIIVFTGLLLKFLIQYIIFCYYEAFYESLRH